MFGVFKENILFFSPASGNDLTCGCKRVYRSRKFPGARKTKNHPGHRDTKSTEKTINLSYYNTTCYDAHPAFLSDLSDSVFSVLVLVLVVQ